MRKMAVVIWFLLVGLFMLYVAASIASGRTRYLLIPHVCLPPVEIGQIDIFGERPVQAKPKTLSAEEFRERFQNSDALALVQTGTLASLREYFGEPITYVGEGLVFTRDALPSWFYMKYPTGVVFHIERQAVAQIDLTEPGYFYNGVLQVGSSLDEVYRNLGEPASTQDMSDAKWGLGRDQYVFEDVPAGTVYIYRSDKYYRPKNTEVLFTFDNDKIRTITFWRFIPEAQPGIPHKPMFRRYPQRVEYRDTSQRFGYFWSGGNKCRKRLEQFDATFKKHTYESKGVLFPPLSSEPGRFEFDTQALFPTYLDDLDLLRCPAAGKGDEPGASGKSEQINVPDYWYFGYFLTNDREGMAFLATYWDHVMNKQPLEKELPVSERALTGTLGHLRQLAEGGERWYIYECCDPNEQLHATALVPILIERPEHHGVPGGHVLYMDGRVEWLPYPGPFPMTPAFIEGVKAVEERLLKMASEK